MKTHFAGKELRVAKRRYSEHFRQVAVERMRGCESIVALTKELGVSRRQLYRWRDEMDPGEPEVGKPPGQKSRVSTLGKEGNHLKRVLAEKTLEVDFFKVPCKKSRLDARRAASLARRHLRSNSGSDAVARRPKHRAHVSTGGGEPGRLVPLAAGTAAGGGRDGSAIRDSADRAGTSAALWLSAYCCGTATSRYGGESQASGADYAGG